MVRNLAKKRQNDLSVSLGHFKAAQQEAKSISRAPNPASLDLGTVSHLNKNLQSVEDLVQNNFLKFSQKSFNRNERNSATIDHPKASLKYSTYVPND